MSGVPNNDQPENMAKNTGVYELADNSKLEAMEGDTKVPMTGTKEDVYTAVTAFGRNRLKKKMFTINVPWKEMKLLFMT